MYKVILFPIETIEKSLNEFSEKNPGLNLISTIGPLMGQNKSSLALANQNVQPIIMAIFYKEEQKNEN